jgi:hypothetical protein
MVSLADFAQEDWNQLQNLCSALEMSFIGESVVCQKLSKQLRHGTVASSSVRRTRVRFVGKAGTLEGKESCSRLGLQL